MSNYWEEDTSDEVDADDLSEIFLDEETLRIAARYEQYRKEYAPPRTQDKSE